MHGAEKPVVGDLVFDVDPETITEKVPEEDENEDGKEGASLC